MIYCLACPSLKMWLRYADGSLPRPTAPDEIPTEITLMAVSKTFPCGRYPRSLRRRAPSFRREPRTGISGKAAAIRDLHDAEWHMIGHLQSNKAGPAAAAFAAIDSLDSLKLAEKLNASAGKLGKKLRVLIEINVGGETAKSGLSPDSDELEELLTAAPRLEQLEFRGLMTIPPFTDDAQEARPYFRKLRSLRDQIAARHLPAVLMDVCRWACPMISKSRLRRVRPACAWAQRSLGNGQSINQGGHGENSDHLAPCCSVSSWLIGLMVLFTTLRLAPPSQSRFIRAPEKTRLPANSKMPSNCL